MENDTDVENQMEFDHAIVPAEVANVLRKLQSLKDVNPREVFSDITRRLEWINQRRIFLSAKSGDASIAWTATGDTGLLKQISLHMLLTVQWVYVDAPTRSWAFLEYQNGRLAELILDPQQTWISGTVSSEVLMGQGNRCYPTLRDFLTSVQDRYTPPDTQWSYPAWTMAQTRDEFLLAPEVYAWAIELAFAANGPHITFHGPVPNELRREFA